MQNVVSEVKDISAASFDKEVLRSEEPIVVEFFSHSCPHCIKFAPVYEELAHALHGDAKFLRIDVLSSTNNRSLAHRRGVRTVPTIEVFYQGRVIGNVVGFHLFEKVRDAIKGFLVKKEENVGPSTPLEHLTAR
ncbi:MAG: thioredoxin family protein [Candidatus Bathyarchaeia archaeon]|jgi:thioredoxin 1